MTPTEILKARRSDLFPSDEAEAKKVYKQLCLDLHPDRNSDPLAKEAFLHVNTLYTTAIQEVTWQVNLRTYKFKYLKEVPFELGKCYIGKKNTLWVVDDGWRNLANNASEHIKSIVVADADKAIIPCIPKVIHSGEEYLVLTHTDGSIRLADLPQLTPGHIFWIINRALRTAAYLALVQNLALNDVSKETVWVHPTTHDVQFIGGWFYAAKLGSTISQVPGRTIGVMPGDIRAAKRSSSKTDLECIRSLARELIGDPFHAVKNGFPQALIDWSNHSAEDPLKDIASFAKVIDANGKRKFLILPHTQEDIYNG